MYNVGALVSIERNRRSEYLVPEAAAVINSWRAIANVVGIEMRDGRPVLLDLSRQFKGKFPLSDLELSDLNFAYVGTMSLSRNGSRIQPYLGCLRIAEELTRLGVPVENPVPILRKISKNYLFDLKRAGLPTLDTRRIHSLDELTSLDNNTVVKPLVSFGGIGTACISDLTQEEKVSYFASYGSGEVSGVPQGIIAQPYSTGFAQVGELKVACAGLEPTLARINRLGKLEGNRLTIVGKASSLIKIELYDLNPKQIETVRSVYEWLQSTGTEPSYYRVDLAWDNNRMLYINELEFSCPVIAALEFIKHRREDELNYHHRRILELSLERNQQKKG